MKIPRFEGSIVPLVTPVDTDGMPDLKAMERLVHFAIEGRSTALFVLGSMGRGPHWDWEIAKSIIQKTLVAADSQAPVLVGCFGTSIEAGISRAEWAKWEGAAAAVITAPCYFRYSQEEAARLIKSFADESKLPVVLYDIPMAGMTLTAENILDIAKHPNVVAVKDSSGVARDDLILPLHELQVSYFQGKELLMLDSLNAGADGIISGFANIWPRAFFDLYEAVRDGQDDKAKLIQTALAFIYGSYDASKTTKSFSDVMRFVHTALKDQSIGEILLPHEDQPTPAQASANLESLRILQQVSA